MLGEQLQDHTDARAGVTAVGFMKEVVKEPWRRKCQQKNDRAHHFRQEDQSSRKSDDGKSMEQKDFWLHPKVNRLQARGLR